MARTISKVDDGVPEGTMYDSFPQDTPVPLVMTVPDDFPDDIPDPVTPLAVVAQSLTPPEVDPSTPAGQMAMNVDQALFRFSEHAGRVLSSVEKSWDAALRALNHNQQGVEALAIALTNYSPCVPYSATVSALTPAGFPITLTCQNRSQEGFLEQMGTLMTFLQDNGFTAQTPIPF